MKKRQNLAVKRKIITDPIYLVDYYVQRGGSLQSAIDRFAKYIKVKPWEVEQSANHRGHFGAHTSHRAGCIWLHDDAGTNTLTHEVCHATNYLLQGLNTSDLAHVDEIFAYYSGWLAAEIVRALF